MLNVNDFREIIVRPAAVHLRRAAGDLVRLTGAAALFDRTMQGGGVIFTGHRVVQEPPRPFAPNAVLGMSPAFLDELLTHLGRRGVPVVNLGEALERVRGASGPFASFTFDDGYRDMLENALPVFRRHNAPFTVFVTVGLTEQSVTPWWMVLEQVIAERAEITIPWDGGTRTYGTASLADKRRVYALVGGRLRSIDAVAREAILESIGGACGAVAAARNSFLDWDGLRELQASGLVEIGCHTITHPLLVSLDDAAAYAELADARARIGRQLGIPVNYLAYPYGDVSACGPREFRLAAQAGFAASFTTVNDLVRAEHLDHPHALPRVDINGMVQNIGYVDWQVSGIPSAIKNRFRARSGVAARPAAAIAAATRASGGAPS